MQGHQITFASYVLAPALLAKHYNADCRCHLTQTWRRKMQELRSVQEALVLFRLSLSPPQRNTPVESYLRTSRKEVTGSTWTGLMLVYHVSRTGERSSSNIQKIHTDMTGHACRYVTNRVQSGQHNTVWTLDFIDSPAFFSCSSAYVIQTRQMCSANVWVRALAETSTHKYINK